MANDTLSSIIELPAQALQESTISLFNALPKAITAVLILFLGWVIAKISEILVKRLLVASRIDEWVVKLKLKATLFNLNVSQVLSLIVKYYVLIVFMKEAAIRTGLEFLTQFFDAILTALPQITVGAAIVIVALVFADFVRKRIRLAVIPFNEGLAELVYGIIIFFAIVMALPKFGLTNTSLLEDTFKYIVLGFSVGISLAVGIGFGWAIKEGPAKQFFKKRK